MPFQKTLARRVVEKDGLCAEGHSNRHYGLLPTKTLIGSFIFMFVFIMAPGSGICVIGYTEQDSPTDLSALERASTASPVDEEGGLSVPIRIPRAAPAAAVPKWTVHFARVNTSLICSVIPTTSAEVPKINIPTVCPPNGESDFVNSFIWTGVKERGASLASNSSLASFSFSAVSFDLAASFCASATFSRSPSTLASASAARVSCFLSSVLASVRPLSNCCNRACWLSFIRLPSISAAEPDTTVRAMRTMVDQSATAFQVSNGIEERPSQPLKIGTYP